LFGNSQTQRFEMGILPWFKFNIDKYKQGFLVSNAGTNGDLRVYFYIANLKTKELRFVEEVNEFYQLHNSLRDKKTKIYFEKDSIILEQKMLHCDFVNDANNPKCDELIHTNKFKY
jgi:hypothetical protein